MGRRDTSRDGFRNKFELHVLTCFGWLWRVIQRNHTLARWINRRLINQAVYKIPTRPRPLSTMAVYSSWDSLTDRSWLGRHLPPDPEFNNPLTLPPLDDVVALFRMRGVDDILSPKSTVLFPYFVQWFSDGFLRVMSDPVDDKSTDPVDVKPGAGDPTVRLRTTSNHHIDLSTVYGINPGFPFCLSRMEPLYTRKPPRPRESSSSHIVQALRPSLQPALTSCGLNPGLPGHSFDTAPHLCPRFAKPASLHAPRVNLPGPVAPRSAGALPRTGVESGGSPPGTASSSARVLLTARPS